MCIFPLLFSVYINEINCNNAVFKLIKYAHDIALTACFKDELSLSQYYQYVDMLVSWFDHSFLKLSAQKTQDMCFGRGRIKGASHPLSQLLMINGQTVETVSTFKHLGTVVDENLTFTDNVDHIYKKAQQRLVLLRKLRSFNVSTEVLQLVYRSLI